MPVISHREDLIIAMMLDDAVLEYCSRRWSLMVENKKQVESKITQGKDVPRRKRK